MFMKRRPGICQCSPLLFYVVLFLGAAIVVGDGRFKPNLESRIFVRTGKTAEFKWDYTVDDRRRDFETLSPRWSFYDSSDHEFIIGHENLAINWAWEVTPRTCPPRLLFPKERVNKTSVATLVIENVTIEDNGIYGCTLLLSTQKTSKMELIVTVPPQITVPSKEEVVEMDTLNVTCSAEGPPIPNITWIRLEGNKNITKKEGIQTATLQIKNITRSQNETYVCYANNNPNEEPMKKEIMVIVKYEPVINKNLSSNIETAYEGQPKATLKCVVDSVPPPTFFWYGPKDDLKLHNKSEYTIETVGMDDFGNWTCNVTNGIGSVVSHKIQLLQVYKDQEEEEKCFTSGALAGIIIGAILAVLIIVAVIAFVIYKIKFEKKPFTEVQKRGILIGLIVAVVIIIIIIIVVVIQLNKCG